MGRDRVCLPFQFLLTSAQGHLKKANFSRKSSMHGQELHFLRKLEVLVSSTIPSHPQYAENRADKCVVGFERQLEEFRSRIRELEAAERKLNVVPKLQKSALKTRKDSVSSSKADSSAQKEVPEYQSSCSSETCSLRSKLTESVKLLSPAYSPRRLEKSLKAAAKGSCLEQEASLQGKQWLKLVDGSSEESEESEELKDFEDEADSKFETFPAKMKGLQPPEPKSPSDADAKNDEFDSGRAAMKNLYKQLLGAGSSGKLVQEFRQTLKALDSLVGDKGGFSEQLARHESSTHQKLEKAATDSKSEDVDFVRGFISSTRTLLDSGSKSGGKLKQKSEDTKRIEKRDSREASAVRKDKRGNREESRKVDWYPRTRPSRDWRDDTRDLHESKVEQSRQVETIVEAKMDKLFSERLGTLVSGTEHALGCIRIELENAREVGQQLKSETENLKRVNDFKLDEFHQTLLKLQKDGTDMKLQVHSLRRLEESLRSDRESIKKLFELLDKDGAARKSELQEIRREQEELCTRILLEGETEKAVIMDRIERLSQLYIGGLEDVKMEVSSLKAAPESTARAESLLSEMRNRRKKSMQLESVMKNAVEAALKLQEKYSLELEKAKDNWNWAMNLQIGEAKAVLGELTEQSQSLSAQLSSFEGHNVLLSRIQSIEGEVRQLMATVKPPLNEAAIYDSIGKHKEAIQQELNRLDEQMQDALKKLESAQNNHDHASLRADLEEKLKEVSNSRAIFLDKITEMGKKVRKLEGAQLNFVRSVEELRTSTSDLEMSASTWLPKYETAASLLKDMDARLGVAESLIKGIEQGKANNVAGSENEADFHLKFESLEDRVENAVSETLSEIRILDTKVEQCKAGVQSALEGAAQAESKCGVLGAEIVKVFRMFAARNGKLTELPGARTGPKEKAHVSCKSCKKANNESSETGQNVSRKKTGVLSPEDYYMQGRPARRNSAAAAEDSTFIDSYAETLYESGRFNSSKSKVEKYSSDDEDEQVQITPAGKCKRKTKERKTTKALQRMNLRLEAGRVVNVPR